MDQSALIWGFLCLFSNLIVGPSLDEEKRKLKGKIEYFSARIDDLETAKMKAGRGRKRKRNDDLCQCIAKGRGAIMEAQSLLCQLGEGSLQEPKRQARGERGFFCFRTHANIVAIQKSFGIMAAHEREVDVLLRCNLRDGQADNGPSHDTIIPAKELFGEAGSTTMAELQDLLLDHKLARIGIQGAEGLGKTALMKHLHNYAVSAVKAVEMFDYVFWITCPAQFSIKKVQDAVAEAIKCDLSNISDLILRARKLCDTLAALGKYVLFLDAVPEVVFSLEQIGIPVSSEGGNCKLVITTRSNSVCRLLDCSGIVQVNPLPEEEALGLFMQEAGIDLGHVHLLHDIPRLLANACGGVPSMIVDIANRMRRIYDICEWRNMLFEIENHAI